MKTSILIGESVRIYSESLSFIPRALSQILATLHRIIRANSGGLRIVFSSDQQEYQLPNLAQILNTKSSPEYRRVFELCREISTGLDDVQGVYVVGGVVRDLILDRVPGDLDLSVVGNAGLFADKLSMRLGGGEPVESQFQTYKFAGESGAIDVVTARSESYSQPGALPEITPSSIEEDLKRRDFTVNSMAVSLSKRDWGTLVDPSGGFGDIMRKRIKVHHDDSFKDDPTRMYRAIRYSTRLGFPLDSRTEDLISNSTGYVEHLSGTRIRSEFELMLGEPARVDILYKAEELGLLGAISPGLRIGSSSMKALETDASDVEQIDDLLALLTFGLSEDEASKVAARFAGPALWTDAITGNPKLAALVSVLDRPDIQRSEVAELLGPIPLASIRAYITVGPPLPRRDRMNEYVEKIRFEQPELTGDDLISAGIPEGPVIGQLIDIVKRAKLDGQVSTKQEELELAKSRLPNFLINP